MPKPLEIDAEIKVFEEGTVELISREDLRRKLLKSREKGKPLRIKYGVDPTTADLHLGHTVPLKKLRALQDLGHQIVFLIGDFTAQIGDPSQQSETRKMLSAELVKKNAVTYQQQVFRILDKSRTEVRYNSEWFGKMNPADFLTLTSRYTVARLLERDDFSERYKTNKPIALLEFLYPLLQGYDSVELRSDIELGGTDQKFNLLVGRELQRDYGQEPQLVITLPILEGTDGVQKMSKSLGNAINIEDSPKEMFGKIMSIPDALMLRYFQYVSGKTSEEVSKLRQKYEKGEIHPRELKVTLAKDLVSLYHNSGAAEKAQQEFDKVFQQGGVPEELPEFRIERGKLKDGRIDILSLLQETQLTATKSEGRRLIQQGGVKVNQKKIDNEREEILLDQDLIVQCGKRKFAKILSNVS